MFKLRNIDMSDFKAEDIIVNKIVSGRTFFKTCPKCGYDNYFKLNEECPVCGENLIMFKINMIEQNNEVVDE